MSLIDLLYVSDLKILHFVNITLARPLNDFVFKIWSSEAPWFSLTAFFLLQTAYRRQWINFRTLLWLGATVGVSDAFAAQVIKPWAGRIRPCKVEGLVRIVEGCAGSMSFPSNHAANGAAFATVSVPVLPPAPALFSITIVWPRYFSVAVASVPLRFDGFQPSTSLASSA